MELEFGAYTIKGKKNGPNQDHYRLFHNEVPLVQTANRGQIFGIFDGMGSTPRASDAAWLVGKNLINFFKVPPPSSQSQITELLYQANQEISDWGFVDSTRSCRQGGCTGTVAWLFNGLHIFHAGDTRALLLRADGQENDGYDALTTDHSEGHALYRYFGLGNALEIDHKTTSVTEGDILVLMTDGVTCVLNNAEIATQIRSWVSCNSGSADLAARNLCELAKTRGSRDDITSVLIELIDLS